MSDRLDLWFRREVLAHEDLLMRFLARAPAPGGLHPCLATEKRKAFGECDLTDDAASQTRAAQMGLLSAQYRLGLCYAYGRGTPDAAKVLEVMREAADRTLVVSPVTAQ